MRMLPRPTGENRNKKEVVIYELTGFHATLPKQVTEEKYRRLPANVRKLYRRRVAGSSVTDIIADLIPGIYGAGEAHMVSPTNIRNEAEGGNSSVSD